MKLIRKTLAQIKLEPCPKMEVEGHIQAILSAKVVNYSGERLLVVTYYNAKSSMPHCRIYLSKTGYISYLYKKAEWTSKGTCSIEAPQTGIKMLSECHAAYSEKTARIVKVYCEGWSDDPATVVMYFQSRLRDKKRQQSREKAKITGDRAMKQAFDTLPPLPDDFEHAILEGPLLNSRYLFFRRADCHDPLTGMKQKRYTGYCTHCKSENSLGYNMPKHKEHTHCPNCGSEVEARARGISRQGLVNTCKYAVQQRAGDAAYLRFFKVTRDYRGEPEQVKTNFYETEIFYFKDGIMWHFSRYEFSFGNRYSTERWRVMRTKHEMCTGYTLYPALPEVWAGTCLAHSQFAQYLAACKQHDWCENATKYLALHLTHPGTEHLINAGLYGIVHGKVQGYKQEGAIDWRQLRPRAMLGISQAEVTLFAQNEEWGESELAAYKSLRPLGVTLEADSDGKNLIDLSSCAHNGFQLFAKTHGLAACVRYLRYQRRKHYGEQGSYAGIYSQWRDYIRFATELGRDMRVKSNLFPPNLPVAHDRTAAQIRERRTLEEQASTERTAAAWAAQYTALLPLVWQCDGLIIRPVCSQQELTEEGDHLEHCVSGYGTRVRKGTTHILLIRRADAPETPYFTLNLSPEGKLIQCHGYKNDAGYKNRTRPDFIKEFEKKWLAEKVKPWLAAKAKEARKLKKAQRAAKEAMATASDAEQEVA